MLQTTAPHACKKPGIRNVAVKSFDTFGNDNMSFDPVNVG